ncbi:MAG: DUF192 domain-containing protein [Thermodesulfobacteriota bacterium]
MRGLLPLAVLFLAAMVLPGAGLMAGCCQAGPAPAAGEEELTFLSGDGAVLATISVEIARDRLARVTGLSRRLSLPADRGMLFVYESERPLSFTMKKTAFSLDILFVDGAGEIKTIVAEAQPYSQRSFSSLLPAQYVVEVNGGFCAAHGIRVGATIRR